MEADMQTDAARLPELCRQRPLQIQRCLVLNADFRPLSTYPLSIVDTKDAVQAVFRDRVSVVETWPEVFFRSPSVSVAVPKVIALREYAPICGEPKFCRRSILLRDRFRCCYCGQRFEAPELTYDHVIPRSRGGRTEWANIVTACLTCNAGKGSSLPNFSGPKGKAMKDGRLRPLKEPRRPTTAELLRAGLEFLPSDIRESFGDYLYWNVELEA
jgi:5-methylcytosine-specific restriction endonuclease McrA